MSRAEPATVPGGDGNRRKGGLSKLPKVFTTCIHIDGIKTSESRGPEYQVGRILIRWLIHCMPKSCVLLLFLTIFIFGR
jgi:hypothetical protein